MPIAEAQSEWIADLLTSKAALPSAPEMRQEIGAYERWLKTGGTQLSHALATRGMVATRGRGGVH